LLKGAPCRPRARLRLRREKPCEDLLCMFHEGTGERARRDSGGVPETAGCVLKEVSSVSFLTDTVIGSKCQARNAPFVNGFEHRSVDYRFSDRYLITTELSKI